MDWKPLTSEYAARKRNAEAAVTTWRYATGELYSLAPAVESKRAPKALRARSTKPGTYAFGFDDEMRLTVIRQHVGRGHAYETFVVWQENKATAVTYEYDPKYKVASRHGVLVLRGGRPVTYTHTSAFGIVVSRYEYKGDVLTNIRIKPRGRAEQTFRPRPVTKTVSRQASKSDVRRMLTKIEERLLREIPKAVRKAVARSKSPVWSCGLVFDGSQPLLPPELALGTTVERERDKAAKDGPSPWNCVTWDGMGAAFFEASVDAACKQVNTHLAVSTGRELTALLTRLARRLNELPRSAFGKTAADFVVFAFDRNRPANALLKASGCL